MKSPYLWRLLFLFGILGVFISPVPFSVEKLGAINPQTDKWQTMAGEWRESGWAESFLRQILEKPGTTALSVAVVQGSRVVFQQSMGIVDRKTKKPVDEQTVFRTASLSKPVFAYLVMKLVDEGVLELDKPLYQYLERPLYEYPDYKDLKSDERYKLLTAKILLSHTSGFPNWRRRRLDFEFTPGERFKYSGEGYCLLQFILENMTGKNLNQLAKEKVFLPLGMTQSAFLWERRFDGNFVVDLRTGLRRKIIRTKSVANSAASLLTNTADYAKFLLAVMNEKGLKSGTHQTMLKPRIMITSKSLHAPQGTNPKIQEAINLSWALGWGRFNSPQGEAIFHVGREEGCDNYAAIFLDHKTGIVIQSVTPVSRSVAPAIVKEFIGDIYSPFAWLRY
ncbi:MAG: serine hydrolase [Candidatus Aminicenantes bacterium]|nr:serine hydrolase [Candidatus Aminicenantes bacterium]